MTFMSELWRFLNARKKLWLLPLIVVALAIGALLGAGERVRAGPVHLHVVLVVRPWP